MFGKINYLFTGKTFNNITTFRLIRQFPRYNSNKMKLYTDKGNLQSLKIAAACFYNNESVDVKFVSKKDFVLPKKCLKSQLPVLEIENERYITQGNVAVNYLFNKSGKGNFSKNQINELTEFDITRVQPVVFPALLSIISKKKTDTTLVTSILSDLEKLLGQNKYFLGDSLSSVDVTLWGSLFGVFQDEQFKSTSLISWFNRVSSEEAFKQAVDKIIGSKDLLVFQDFLESYSPPASTNCKPVDQKQTKGPAKSTSTNETATEETVKLSGQEISDAKTSWLKGPNSVPKARKYENPVLPKEGEKNILITSALPYVNNVPHLGNIIGCTLSGDVYSRYCRLRNYTSVYICGTDEYGTATETKALAEGLTPKEICDKYSKLHKEVYDWFNIKFDYFGRTSADKQTKIVQDIFSKVHKNGFVIEDTVDQLQCENCDRFLADRFVEGICPLCKYEDARGDQCDACGKLINAIELIKPRCKQCGNTPRVKTSKHLFLDLPKVESKLKDWINNNTEVRKDGWTPNVRQITKGWIQEGLKPRCITRDLKWGIPVPLKGFEKKVFYVWFDAPIGYISMTASYTEHWEKWWKNPEQVRLVQFMAKDNVPFHTVVFPSSLIAANDNFIRDVDISSTEYLNYEDAKFSKSRGVGVFGDQVMSTGIPADIFRFYLLFVRPESSDSAFQWADLITKNNSELLNNLGNFVNRSLTFLKNSFNSTMPALNMTEDDYILVAHINKELHEYITLLEQFKLRDALKVILNVSRHGNQYMQSNKPWVLIKGTEADKERAGTIIGLSSNISALLCIIMKPYMPEISAQLQAQLTLSDDLFVIPDHFVQILPTGHVAGSPVPLFQKLEASFGEEMKARFGGKQETTSKSTTTTSGSVPQASLEELEEKVTKQGALVRDMKAAGADKAAITEQVQMLLAAKKALAVAKGEDPNAAPPAKGGKKKKGGKK